MTHHDARYGTALSHQLEGYPRWSRGATALHCHYESSLRLITIDADVLSSHDVQGPADVWFGAGFGNPTMKGTYAIVVDGAAGDVTERSLGDHDPGQQLAPSVTVLNNTVVNGIRTVVVTRTLAGASAQHYTFAAGAQGVAMVAAVGSSPTFAYHKARGSTTLMLVQVGSPMCICTKQYPAVLFT